MSDETGALSFPRTRESIGVNAETGVDSRFRGNDGTRSETSEVDSRLRGNDGTRSETSEVDSRFRGNDGSGDGLPASASIPIATPEQAALKMTNPWILLKMKALGELVPAAYASLEAGIDQGMKARDISRFLHREFKVILSELEVARYGGWLPRIREDAIQKAEDLSEQRVKEAKERGAGLLRPAWNNPVAALAARKRRGGPLCPPGKRTH